jgi:hypothetical protein
MLSENEPKSTRVVNGQFITLGVIIVALIIMGICAFVIFSLRQQLTPRPTPTPEIVMVNLPAEVQANDYTVRLPVVLSGSAPVSAPVPVPAAVSGQIWKVTKIKKLGYEMDGRRYDVAIFKRVDSEETVKAYCINRGWETPDIGTEYLLNAGGIFVPLDERDADPFQRFLMIQ